MNKKIIILLICLGLIAVGLSMVRFQKTPKTILILPKQQSMNISSSAFANDAPIPATYTCDGQNINPMLQINQVPENAKGLALILDDPDSPSGDFVHWLMWNIKPDINSIQENSIPVGAVQGENSAGKNSYFGPCPNIGTHHYHFKLYALDTILQLNASSKKSDLENAMQNHILDFAEVIGLYARK